MQKKILVLVANPKGTINLNLLPEIRELKEALRRSLNRERFEVVWEVAVKRTDLYDYILETKPQIVHFCGHSTKQGLFLEDDQGQATVVSKQVITHLLKNFADRIECVLLNACDSENLADELGQHLNYVIGMSQEVRDDAAIAFAKAFYAALGAGELYERAFEGGKTAVLDLAESRQAEHRKAIVVDEAGNPVQSRNPEHQIPVLKVNPHPTVIQSVWLSLEQRQQAIRELLAAMAGEVNHIKLFHTDQPIVLQDQYIPIQVTLERRYRHTVETIGGYAESEAELKRIYAMKGSEAEMQRQQVDWDEAKQKQSRLIVLADPGMGKSTLLKREAITVLQQANQALSAGKPLPEVTLPLLIRLSTLADETTTLPTEEAILKIVQEQYPHLFKHHPDAEVMAFLNGFLKTQLLSGRALLLLDALDEVPDQQRSKLLEKLDIFAKAFSACPIIGTSRIVGYGGKWLNGAKDLEIVPFTQKNSETYVEKWFQNAQPSLQDQSAKPHGLIQALRERPQLAGLAQNPLLLSLICSLFQRNQLTLPARRSEIYEQAVNCILSEWNQTRPNHDKNRTAAKIRLLEALAYYFSRKGQEVFDYDDLYDWVEDYLDSDNVPRDLRDAGTGDLIAELSEEDGILHKLYRDRQDQQYLFLHRTFQEYFTACSLKRLIKKNKQNSAYITELVRQYHWKYNWHETLILLAGLMNDPFSLLEAILAEKDDIFQTQLLLAGRCLAECREISHPLADQLIDRIYQFWLNHPEAEFIQAVVVILSQTRVRLAQILRTALEDETSDVRYYAAVIMKNIDREGVIDALATSLFDLESYVSRSIPAVLGGIGTEKAVDTLIQALSHPDFYIRCQSAIVLGNMNIGKAVGPLIQALSDENSWVRRNAAEALGIICDERAFPALIHVLSDQDTYVGYRVAEALGKINNERAANHLILALSSQDSYTRYFTVGALGKINGSEKVLYALVRALSDHEANVRSKAAEALGNINHEKAAESLIQVLCDKSPEVRSSAAKALGKIGNGTVVNSLIQALSDQNSDVRYRAAEALGKIGGERAIIFLITALFDQNSSVRSYSAEALGKIGDEKVVDSLVQSLFDQYSYIRSKVAEALGKIGGGKAIDLLIRVISDQHKDVRSSVAEALGKIGSEKAIDPLIRAISDQNSDVRYRVIEALGRIDSERIIEPLILALSDQNSNVRNSAVYTLTKTGNVTSLEKLLQLPNLDLKDTAIFSLGTCAKIRYPSF